MTSDRLLMMATLAAAMAALPAMRLSAADHRDGPRITDLNLIPSSDLNDVYIFKTAPQSPMTVLIVTMNPMAGLVEPTTFLANAKYEVLVDSDGDAAPNTTFRITFSQQTRSGEQELTVTGADGRVRARGLVGQTVALGGGGRMMAGVFDDPFFFDMISFRQSMDFCSGDTGINFFRGLNTNAIVFEVPHDMLGGPQVAVWGRIVTNGGQADRMAQPSVNAVLIPDPRRSEFNRGAPANDAAFRSDLISSLIALGNDAGLAGSIADGLLPDVLRFDANNPAGFPNGRRLDDDVIDHDLGSWTNGRVTRDCVASDSAFASGFPYLAPANP